MRPVRALVTGGAGFLGSHLVERLLERGQEVVVLDNFFTGSRSNLAHVISHAGLEIIRHDIVHPILIEVDQIYNLACPASPIHYQRNPIKTVKTNVMGTINMLGLCRRVKGRFLQASTSEVYGDPLEHPQTEEYWGNVNPVGIRSCYDEGKRVAETLCMDYHRQNRVEVRIARIFNTYGPRMTFNDGRVVSNFVIQALKGQPISIYGDGQQTRSFCYVDDMVEALIRFMEVADPSVTGPVNLGNASEFTMLELAKLVIELSESSSQIEFRPLPQDDPRQRRPNTDLARKWLNWEATTSLREGLTHTIANFRHRVASL